MKKYLVFSLSLFTFTSLMKAADVTTVFNEAVAANNKPVAQAVFKFITDEDDQQDAKDAYTLGDADADLIATPSDEAGIKTRFVELMTADGQPGKVLSDQFNKKLTDK